MISLDYRCEQKDWVAFAGLATKKATGRFYRLLVVAVCLLILASPIVAARFGPPDFNEASFIQGVSVTFLIWMSCNLVVRTLLQRNYLRDDGTILGERHLNLCDDRIEIIGKHNRASYDWTVVDGITTTTKLVVIWLEPSVGIIVPRRAFKNSDALEGFGNFVRQRMKSANR